MANRRPRLSLIVALNLRGVIGDGNRLLWNLPRDMQRFRSVTLDHPIIMGRKTFESIGRPLPRRTHVILTRDPGFEAAGCHVVHSIMDALALDAVQTADEAMVIGGVQVYAQFLPRVERLYLTLVHNEAAGDAVFPCWERFVPHLLRAPDAGGGESTSSTCRETERTSVGLDAQHLYGCTFVTWEGPAGFALTL